MKQNHVNVETENIQDIQQKNKCGGRGRRNRPRRTDEKDDQIYLPNKIMNGEQKTKNETYL